MWRALFLGLGIFCCLLGVEALAIDKAILSGPRSGTGGPQVIRREITPPPWAPWSLMSTGAVVVLYSFSIPKRVKE